LNKTNKIIAIIPARGGSKGIPKKNIIVLNGKPLIAYTIEAALKSKYISEVVVSSEDEEILKVSKKFGANIIKRPYKLAHDVSPCEPVILNVLKELKKNKKGFDVIVLLQPTSPLRDAIDIDNAIELFFKKNATALISVYKPLHSPFKAFKLSNNGLLEGIVDSETPFKCRQDIPICYYPNGAIFIIYTKLFLKYKKLFTDKTIPYVMPEEKSIDIDTHEDVQKVLNFLNSPDK